MKISLRLLHRPRKYIRHLHQNNRDKHNRILYIPHSHHLHRLHRLHRLFRNLRLELNSATTTTVKINERR